MDFTKLDFDRPIDLNDYVYKDQVIGLANMRSETPGYKYRREVFENVI